MEVLRIQGYVQGKIRSYERKNKEGDYCIIKLKVNDSTFPRKIVNLVYFGPSAKFFQAILEPGSKIKVYRGYKIHESGLKFMKRFRPAYYYVTSLGIG